MTEIPESRRAPEGHAWRCPCCGKWAEDRYGIIGRKSAGWDESCALNAITTDSKNAPWNWR